METDKTHTLKLPATFRQDVVKVAQKFLGEREEAGNKFKDTTVLGKALHAAGQKDGQAWCAYFVEVVYKYALADLEKWKTDPDVIAIDKLHSAGAVQTFRNFAGDPNKVFEFTNKPKPGDLICFQNYFNGKPQITGHIGIVESVRTDASVMTIEGNTNDEGSSEGYEVARRRRSLDFDIPKQGKKMVLLGFITAK